MFEDMSLSCCRGAEFDTAPSTASNAPARAQDNPVPAQDDPASSAKIVLYPEEAALSSSDGYFEKSVLVLDDYGLHARPAARLVKAAQEFLSDIQLVSASGQAADARSILDVLSLAVAKNDEITVRCSGIDALRAGEALCAMLRGMSREI